MTTAWAPAFVQRMPPLVSLAAERAAGGFDDAGADGELLGHELGIAHALTVRGEVVLRVLEFPFLSRRARSAFAESLHERCRALFQQGPQDGTYPNMAIEGTLPKKTSAPTSLSASNASHRRAIRLYPAMKIGPATP